MAKTLEEIDLVGGHPAVDFVNTVHDWTTPSPRDYLGDYADFLRWNEIAGLLEAPAVRHFRGRPAAEREAALGDARALRAALHRVYARLATGRPPPRRAVERLDGVLRRTAGWRRLGVQPAGVRIRWDFRAAPAAAALAPVAWQATEFLERGATDRLKECPGEACGWIFVDTSKNRSRTWCSMKACGNAAKVRRYRARRSRAAR